MIAKAYELHKKANKLCNIANPCNYTIPKFKLEATHKNKLQKICCYSFIMDISFLIL